MDKPMKILYSGERTAKHTCTAYIAHYKLCSGDWFEVGFAYSLHPDRQSAIDYKYTRWWRPTERGKKVFVTPSTLERIVRNGNIWKSWEN